MIVLVMNTCFRGRCRLTIARMLTVTRACLADVADKALQPRHRLDDGHHRQTPSGTDSGSVDPSATATSRGQLPWHRPEGSCMLGLSASR